MAEQFYTIPTAIGKAKIANSIALGAKVNLKTMKIGDSNGIYYNPSESQTDLVHTVYSCEINSVEIDESNSNWINVVCAIPADVGDFFIREVGIFDDNNDLIAIGKYPETYKPLASNGSTKELYIKMTFEVTNVSSVTLKIDPTVILATKNDINILTNSISSINAQLSDMVYQTAGGSATAITLTIKGTLVNGYPITFIASANNGGAAITINGKKLYKPGTTTSPNLISGKAYTVWYNSTGDCFFIKASAEGDALAKDVRKNTTFSNDNDTGIQGGLDLSLLVSGNLRAGVTIDGVTGKSSVVDTTDALATATQLLSGASAYINGAKILGTMVNHTFASMGGYTSPASIKADGGGNLCVAPQTGYYTSEVNGSGFGEIIMYDANYVSDNILKNRSVFGLTGTAPRTFSGTINHLTNATDTVNLPFNARCILINYSRADGTVLWFFGSPYNTNNQFVSFNWGAPSYATWLTTANNCASIIVGAALTATTLTYYAWE